MELILEKWEEILRTVKEEHELTDISFTYWLKPLSVCNIEGSKLYILVPSEDVGINYITKKYKLPIKVAIAEITGIDYDLEFIHRNRPTGSSPGKARIHHLPKAQKKVISTPTIPLNLSSSAIITNLPMLPVLQ